MHTIDAPADIHTVHGEETVQTSARLATPEEVAQLKAALGSDKATNQKISVLIL